MPVSLMTEGGMTLSGVLSGVGTVLSSVVDTCADNPVTAVVIGISVIGVGVGLFRKFLHVGR